MPLNCSLLAWLSFFMLNFFDSRQKRGSAAAFSNPLVINGVIGILSSVEVLSVFLFILFLVWTFYTRISQDFTKLTPVESLKLDL